MAVFRPRSPFVLFETFPSGGGSMFKGRFGEVQNWLFRAVALSILLAIPSISIAAPSITVTYPNGGETWQVGTTQTIRWIYAGSPGTAVKIELLQGDAISRILSSSTSIGSGGSGSFSWTVPASVIAGSDYKIKVTSISNAGYTDASNNKFSITAAGGYSVKGLTSTTVSLAGVHWYGGDSNILDMSAPWGTRGWNVEAIYDVSHCDGNRNTAIGGTDVRSKAIKARDDGLVNIIRIDYRNGLAVPRNNSEFDDWAAKFIQCIQELNDVANLFIVGNEPNLEDGAWGRNGGIRPQQYADAFNYLYQRKPTGVRLLVAGPSGFSPPEWLGETAARITNADGFALHTYGDPNHCSDPRQPCSRGGWWFDGGFQYFKDLIAQIPQRFWAQPVYITEFNTDVDGPAQAPNPAQNYRNYWINQAFQAVRDYNATRGSKPEVKALAWFVDRDDSNGGDWASFALRNIEVARNNMSCEFRNPANRGGSVNTCPVGYAQQPANQPDVYIEDLWWTPENPLPGSSVQFHVQVKNKGNASTQATCRQPPDCGVGVGFFVNDIYIGWGSHNQIAAGDSVVISLTSSTWTVPAVGSYILRAHVDDIDRFLESDEGNNVSQRTLVISPLLLCARDAVPAGHWKGEYFKNYTDRNARLPTNPHMVRDDTLLMKRSDAFLSFHWGAGAPHSCLGEDGKDNFAVRWTKTVYLSRGIYEFHLRSDDGSRLYINDSKIIENWSDQDGSQTRIHRQELPSGDHTIKLEYYERGGNALVELSWKLVGTPPSDIPGPIIFETGWEDGQPRGFEKRVEYRRNVTSCLSPDQPPACLRLDRSRNIVRTGHYSLRVGGCSNAPQAYCYYRVFNTEIPIKQGMKLSYYIYHPRTWGDSPNTNKVSVDGHFADGNTIRDFGGGILKDQYGVRIHPAARQDPYDTWYYVEVDLSPAAGKTLDTIMFAFDDNRPGGFTGRYIAFIDDFKIFYSDIQSITHGRPTGRFGDGGQTNAITEPGTWRLAKDYYGFNGIDRIALQSYCGEMGYYATGGSQNALIEYLMKFGGQYSRLWLRGVAVNPGPVKMEIYVDGYYKATVAWDQNNNCNQNVAVDIPGVPFGTHSIAVKFVNDYYDAARGIDRNFILYGLMVNASYPPTQWRLPVGNGSAMDGWVMTNALGETYLNYRGHLGEDWAKNGGCLGEPVLAAASGRVKMVKRSAPCGSYLNPIVLEHHVPGFVEPIYSLYGHIRADSYVQEGIWVERGQRIGSIGDVSSFGFAPHLHFMIMNRTAFLRGPHMCSNADEEWYIHAGYSGISNDYRAENDYYDPSDGIANNRFYHPRRFMEGQQ